MSKIINEAPAHLTITNPGKFIKDIIILKRSLLKDGKRADAKLNDTLSPSGEEKLNIVFFKQLPGAGGKLTTNIGKTGYKKNLVPNLAFVYRAQKVYPYQMASDNDNRFVPWCFRDTKIWLVSSHMPFTATGDKLIERCKDMRGMAESLQSKGYNVVKIAGDHNTSANRMAEVCESALPSDNGTVEIHTS